MSRVFNPTIFFLEVQGYDQEQYIYTHAYINHPPGGLSENAI